MSDAIICSSFARSLARAPIDCVSRRRLWKLKLNDDDDKSQILSLCEHIADIKELFYEISKIFSNKNSKSEF